MWFHTYFFLSLVLVLCLLSLWLVLHFNSLALYFPLLSSHPHSFSFYLRPGADILSLHVRQRVRPSVRRGRPKSGSTGTGDKLVILVHFFVLLRTPPTVLIGEC